MGRDCLTWTRTFLISCFDSRRLWSQPHSVRPNNTCEISDIMFTQQIEVNFYMYVHPLEKMFVRINTAIFTIHNIICVRMRFPNKEGTKTNFNGEKQTKNWECSIL